MNEQQKDLVRATIPVLQSSGVALTTHFYQRMLNHNPELKHIFNQGHQGAGRQQQALAGAVLAYASHIDDPSVLLPVVERIAHKHVSLGIRAEHYAIVGKHLLASIQEVLGDAATPELIDAWAAAYGQLAQLFIDLESSLYQQSVDAAGGWSGWRPFRIVRKQAESAEITSFYMQPIDGGSLPHYQPGQYISLRVYVEELGIYQPRQYSLSDMAGANEFRISVKRQGAGETTPAGKVSNLLHANYDVGQVVELSAPGGEFYLQQQSNRPVVLLSGGVGITPMIAIGKTLHQQGQREIHFVHSARNSQVHAFKSVSDGFAEKGAKVHYFYDRPQADEAYARSAPFAIADVLPSSPLEAEYYLCGPLPFMRHYITELKAHGVPETQIYAEAFGSGGV
ncbi:NO-inducible flavohemoprotein [Shewanella sp. A25]|nr:NO-inducible flavohemoprotein [Shewanella shenzhenensis]